MYKGTSKSETFRDRVASDSTKPFAGGRVDVLPPHAKPWEEIYLGLRAQYEVAIKQYESFVERLQKTNERLLVTMPRLEYEQTVRTRAAYIDKVKHYAGVTSELRDAAIQASKNSLGGCFLSVAERMLTSELYSEIYEETIKIIAEQTSGTALPEIMVQQSNLTDNQRNRISVLALRVLHPLGPQAQKFKRQRAKKALRDLRDLRASHSSKS